jgi:hypothetical protein
MEASKSSLAFAFFPPPPRSDPDPSAARVRPANTNADWTEDKIKPRHWFTRTGLTNGRHAKLHTAPLPIPDSPPFRTMTPMATGDSGSAA